MTTTAGEMRSAALDVGSAPATPSRDVLLDKARSISEYAWSRKADSELNRRLSDDVIEKLVQSGLMRVSRQRRWGGMELELHTLLDVGREVARGCGSLGWIYSVNSTHDWYLSFTDEQCQQDIWGADRDAIVCDSLAMMGKAEEVQDGWLLSGHWRFASGIEWASWIAVGVLLHTEGEERPEPVMMLVPKADVRIEDQWNTIGLRGTASNDVIIDGAFVPKHRMFPFMRLAAGGGAAVGSTLQDESPYWRLHLASVLAFCFLPTALGIGQRSIDEFTRYTEKRVRTYEPGAEAREAPAAQLALAEATVQWDSAWALANRFIDEAWALAESGVAQTPQDRARFKAWQAYSARTCVEVTDRLYTDAGAMALFDSHPMQQVFRDMHAAGAHFAVGRGDAYTTLGRTLMGFPSTTFL